MVPMAPDATHPVSPEVAAVFRPNGTHTERAATEVVGLTALGKDDRLVGMRTGGDITI
jgi:hypothetical protein